MIGYIKGNVVDILENGILFDHDGIGFIIFTSSATAAALSGQDDVTVYTYMNVREDAMELYGFASLEEREFFIKLISVNGFFYLPPSPPMYEQGCLYALKTL